MKKCIISNTQMQHKILSTSVHSVIVRVVLCAWEILHELIDTVMHQCRVTKH